MRFVNKLFLALYSSRLKAIELYYQHPFKIQEKQLQNILSQAKNTEFGKKYSFSSIKSIQKFQETVPVVDYESYYTWIERIRQGEKNIIWPGKIKWLAKSSGTTNDKSKFIPVSSKALKYCHYRGGTDVLLLYLINNPKSKLLSGKTLTLGGSHQLDKFCNNIHIGDLSAIMLQQIPSWANFFRTPPKKIALIADFDEKLRKLIPIIIKQNVTAFAGVPSWNLVLMKRILEYTKKSNLLEIWPNLELFMHGGVDFQPYRMQYQSIIPSSQMNYLDTYNASEGFFAIQNEKSDPSMLLMLDYGIFYEFIPMDKFQCNNFSAVSLHDVKPGINYAMVISTNGGLWRYIIGDTVMFTSVNPYKIIITGRTKQYLNAFGEEVMIHNAEKAIDTAAQQTNAIIAEYTVAPIFMDENAKGCHEWIIEFEKEPNNLNIFTQILDDTLKSVNSDYEAKRFKNTTLQMPVIRIVPKGTFYRWFVTKNKVGGQNKVPRLSNNRKYIDELLNIAQYNQ